jgi:hypothetical protein
MTIREYKLEATPDGLVTPNWIDSGGYWRRGNKFIGLIRAQPKFYVPSSVVTLTLAQLITRQLAIHANKPMIRKEDGIEMTIAEVTTLVEDWFDNYTQKFASKYVDGVDVNPRPRRVERRRGINLK